MFFLAMIHLQIYLDYTKQWCVKWLANAFCKIRVACLIDWCLKWLVHASPKGNMRVWSLARHCPRYLQRLIAITWDKIHHGYPYSFGATQFLLKGPMGFKFNHILFKSINYRWWYVSRRLECKAKKSLARRDPIYL